jgi:hypothetical protein
MRRDANEGRREERGNVLVFVTLALIALFGFAAWSTETGQAWTARGQLQAASDSAALAGAGELLEPNSNQPADPGAAVAAAQAFGLENRAINVPIAIPAGDIETGSWDMQTRIFTPLPGSTDPEQVRAVRLLGRRDDTANGPIPTVLGRIMGVDSINVSTEAIAYIGWAGLMPPGTALLPIALDCCKISGATCDQSYCDYVVANPPNPIPLTEDPSKMVTRLEFASSGEQNACWTELDAVDSSINTPGLEDIIEDGNPVAVGAKPIYVDNGTKAAVIKDIADRFYDSGKYSNTPGGGEDTPGSPPGNDTWLVPLPIIECQNPGDGCAGGSAQKIVGVACLDIKEVNESPDNILRAEFVCPSDPRWDASKCSVGFGPGGEVPSIDAQYPVLVD